ncbi:hypothetical protein PVK06_032280 [Gossypium arboreum]|uniref:Calcineurin B-like protein n=1 Tax=Gossypium arboreum TaxID=29729 RepID=A0ABR0NTB8_GOSAR|nr:hypothetical protein PVK06_032280 [Gossypium arboreum]
MGCFCLKKLRHKAGYEAPINLASETPSSLKFGKINTYSFTISFKFTFFEMFSKQEEFQLALFKNSNKQNLFADRVSILSFGTIFFFLFKLYDLRQTGCIEVEELKEMVMALLCENNMSLSGDVVDLIVEKTMIEADTKRDGKIDDEEWKEFVKKNPSVIKIMTLSDLKDLTLAFPSFVMNSEVRDL